MPEGIEWRCSILWYCFFFHNSFNFFKFTNASVAETAPNHYWATAISSYGRMKWTQRYFQYFGYFSTDNSFHWTILNLEKYNSEAIYMKKRAQLCINATTVKLTDLQFFMTLQCTRHDNTIVFCLNDWHETFWTAAESIFVRKTTENPMRQFWTLFTIFGHRLFSYRFLWKFQ